MLDFIDLLTFEVNVACGCEWSSNSSETS